MTIIVQKIKHGLNGRDWVPWRPSRLDRPFEGKGKGSNVGPDPSQYLELDRGSEPSYDLNHP